MTVRAKATLILASLVFLNLAIWGAKTAVGDLFHPILKAVGA